MSEPTNTLTFDWHDDGTITVTANKTPTTVFSNDKLAGGGTTYEMVGMFLNDALMAGGAFKP